MCRCSRRSWEEVVATSRFMQSCKTSEGDSSSLQVYNSGVGPITCDPYPSRITWICTTGPWGISIEGLLYCQQRNDCTSFCRRDQAGNSSEKILSCNSKRWSCLENHENDFCKANKKKHNTPTTANNQELLQRKSLVESKERTFVGIGDGSGAREERATATQKSHETLQLPIPLQQTHVFFLFCFSSTKPR